MEWIQRNMRLAIGIAVVIALVITVASIMQYRISITNQGEKWQERIETRYQQAQTSLSNCLDSGRASAQVAEAEFERLKDILVDVTSARYEGPDNRPLDAEAALGTGRAFSMIVENYPTIDQRSWQSLQSTVVGCRKEFQGTQNLLFIDANEFDTWALTDNLFNQGIKDNFPTDELEVLDIANGETLRGQGALDYMTRVIMVAEARNAYESGTLGEQDLFGD